ncbi:MAG: PleD family two-component system response regulator [Leptolyngbya sp. BL-A-14]
MNNKRGSRVLIVDDIADNLLLLQLVLENEGYIVELAMNGVTALSKARASPPALVLLDVMMPEMNGFEVTQHLRKTEGFSLLPIILVTADQDVDLEQALAVGANDLICKPLDVDDLLARIKSCFAERA